MSALQQEIDEAVRKAIAPLVEQLSELMAQMPALPHDEKEDHDLTRDEVAKILKCDPQTVGRYVKKGKIRSYRIGNGLRFKRRWVEDFQSSR